MPTRTGHRGLVLTLVAAALAVGACGGSASVTPAITAAAASVAPASSSEPAATAAAGAGVVLVTWNGQTATLGKVTCDDSAKSGVDVRAGTWGKFNEAGPDGIMMLIPHNADSPTITGRIGNKAFIVNGNDATSSVADDLSGKFYGLDKDGNTVEGTFRCS